jgi:hypothetical protein
MTELTDQQVHLSNLLDQRSQIMTQIEELNSKTTASRDLYLRIQGAIEYLQQIGVQLPETVETAEEEIMTDTQK